ncbi:hypothetical protein [Sphaerisporangium sp. TRM90804]|uniref:hypothetical protein n=1 Tax=Sphaerisporangium sp. TRM90804 TaxID=3031113 RepID=UPI002448AB50|nr:hypothetical protein [Sphaerisporangium sp. TRM90804]MDH2424857.1 hypothetical protein [Sphaerisporangium sp. TRM90804]
MSDIESRLGEDEARLLTEQIKAATEQLYSLLLRAHEGQAWSALGYDSWRDYAMTEFGMSQSRAYQLLDHGRVVRALETVPEKADLDSTIVEVDQLPGPVRVPTESQARELAPLLDKPEKLRETWNHAVQGAGGKPTAAAVRQAREVVAPKPTPLRTAPPVTPTPEVVEVVDAEIVEDDPATPSDDQLLDAIEKRQPGARAEVNRTRVRARWSRSIAAVADLPLQDAEEVAAALTEAELQVATAMVRDVTEWLEAVRAARRPGLRVIGGGAR